MVEQTNINIEQLRQQFKFLCSDSRILGIILYGSTASGQNHIKSDIDICIVAPNHDKYPIYQTYINKIKGNIEKFDVRFFEELPLLIRADVIEKGFILCSKDVGELTEYYFFSTRRELEDYRYMVKFRI